jgi:DNA polymerase-3 subunit chi
VTRVEFYHDAPDRLAAACRLVGDLYRQGRKVWIYAPDPAVAAAIDRLMWVQPATGFVPHCAAEAPLAQETPVLIGRTVEDTGHDDVLVNLDGDLPPGFGRFRQLLEIVGRSDEERLPARGRYKFYRDRGYPLEAQPCPA